MVRRASGRPSRRDKIEKTAQYSVTDKKNISQDPTQNPVMKPGDNPVMKPGDNPVIKRKHILNIIGNDQKIARYLFHSSLANGTQYESKPFTKRELSQDLDVKYETLRSTLKRLKKWGFIEEIFSTKGGPGSVSWVRFTPTRYEEMRREYKQARVTKKNPVMKPGDNPVT